MAKSSVAHRARPPAMRVLGGLLLGTLFCAGLTQASQAQMTGGERIYFEKGGCNQCHGRNGDGVGDDARESGANLRETGLDKELLVEIISCGIPGTNMPYFEKFSYTDDRCYGMTSEDIGSDKPQGPLTTFLAKRDIDAVADYILDNFAGKGPVGPAAAAPAAASTPPQSH
ncbi:c-type cytochrome [Devosia sp. A369]